MFDFAYNSDEDLQVLVKKQDWLASLPKHDSTEGIFDAKKGRYVFEYLYIILWYFDARFYKFLIKSVCMYLLKLTKLNKTEHILYVLVTNKS